MKRHLLQFATVMFLSGGFCAYGGELSYIPVPASQSDASSGINAANQYTTALDAGSEANRVVNGVTLYASPGSGQNIVASNCSVTASSGSLITTGGATENIQADGALREVLSDVIYNSDAADNSQQEIVLNPTSLTLGATYDLRVYIGKGGNGDRQVNLAFVGDGRAPLETGPFNEDDARTSPGGFQDPNQVYVINYRFTWDGNSAPGVTVTQKSGQAPFVLYALTNHPVAAPANAAAAPPPQAISTGLVTAEADEVGVTSDTFYSNESLNKNGRWISVKKYGKCWQPTGCPTDWRPYTRGTFRHSDEHGWTWVSDATEEEWGWATYHYGRWFQVKGVGCGWAWVPGTVWAGSWVSWRNGKDPECSCVGWAPLPPEAVCKVNVGVSTWADKEYDIGPDHYTFVNVRDFGADSYDRCGECIIRRDRYVNIMEHTVNITNISFTRRTNVNVNVHVNIYNGGPDLSWCNTEIRRQGGREIAGIRINLYDDPGKSYGGRHSRLDGNVLAVFSPRVIGVKNPKFSPKIVINVPNSKIDRGWNQIKDTKIRTDLKTKIADQTKGLTPETTKAELPKEVATKLATGVGQGTAATAGGDVDWKATVRGDGTDVMPTDPKALASLKAYAAQNATSPETFFSMYTKQAAADRAAEKAAKNPKDAQARADAAAADAEYKKAFAAFDAEAVANKSKAVSSPLPTARTPIPGVEGVTGPEGPKGATATPGQSPSATLSADQIKALDPLNLNKGKSPSPSASPSATLSADQIKALDPLNLNKGKSPSPSASPSATLSADQIKALDPFGLNKGATATPTTSPTRTFPETYKPPLTLKSVTPTASPSATVAGSASPSRTFPETYKAPLTLKSPTPGATGTAAPAATASPARTFPETYKAPVTLKGASPSPSASPTGTASPTRTFPETYKAPVTLKSATPTPSPTGKQSGPAILKDSEPLGTAPPETGTSPTRTFPETYKAPVTLKSATPTPSVAKKSGPAFLKDAETPPPTASPARTFPETYKPPITLKSPAPGATGTATPATGASPTRTFPETYKPPITLKSATPASTATKVPAAPKGLTLEGQTTPTVTSTPIKTPVPKTQPAASPQFKPVVSPSPRPVASPQFSPADASPQPRTAPVKTAQPKIQPAASPTPRPPARSDVAASPQPRTTPVPTAPPKLQPKIQPAATPPPPTSPTPATRIASPPPASPIPAKLKPTPTPSPDPLKP